MPTKILHEEEKKNPDIGNLNNNAIKRQLFFIKSLKTYRYHMTLSQVPPVLISIFIFFVDF